MEGITEFLSVFLDAVSRLTFSAAVGGLAWWWLIRAVEQRTGVDPHLTRKTAILIGWTAGTLGLAQCFELAMKALTLAQTLHGPVMTAFLSTTQFQARSAQIILAGTFSAMAFRLRDHPHAVSRWTWSAAPALGVVISGAWLTHAAGRYDERAWLMTLTSLHEVGAASWVGGIIGLLTTWRMTRTNPAVSVVWHPVLRQFILLGGSSVVLLLLTGTVLATDFVGSWAGFIGTAYGALLAGKIIMLAAALALAGLNFFSARRGIPGVLTAKVPYYLETEAILLFVILLTATSLSAQAPARDVTQERASWSEVAASLTPKAPTLTSPTIAEVNAEDAAHSLVAGGEQPANVAWSEYNHNVAGLFVMALGLLGLIAQRWPDSPFRHWPLGFVLLAVFLGARSDPDTWPLGHIGFWEGTLGSVETLQHRVAVLVALALGILEWRTRLKPIGTSRWAWAFPALALFGGMLLLTHAHSTFERKEEFLIQLSHNGIGILAVFLGCCRWLELRLGKDGGTIPGMAAMIFMVGIGVILTGYREPIVPDSPLDLTHIPSLFARR